MTCLLLCYFCYKEMCLDLDYKLDNWHIEMLSDTEKGKFPKSLICDKCPVSYMYIPIPATVIMILKEPTDESTF